MVYKHPHYLNMVIFLFRSSWHKFDFYSHFCTATRVLCCTCSWRALVEGAVLANEVRSQDESLQARIRSSQYPVSVHVLLEFCTPLCQILLGCSIWSHGCHKTISANGWIVHNTVVITAWQPSTRFRSFCHAHFCNIGSFRQVIFANSRNATSLMTFLYTHTHTHTPLHTHCAV